jgi:hypothetical protein
MSNGFITVNIISAASEVDNIFMWLAKQNWQKRSSLKDQHVRVAFSKRSFLAASTECSAGSNDHFVVGGGVGGVHL